MNTILLTYWLIQPAPDLCPISDMQQLGANGVFAPIFKSGERHILVVQARFDTGDPNAVISAFLYAMNNAKRNASLQHPEAIVYAHECWLNGEKLNMSEPVS